MERILTLTIDIFFGYLSMVAKSYPTFTVRTDYVGDMPHIVTLKPVATPNMSESTEVATINEVAGALKREVHRVVRLYKPAWSFTTINARVFVTLNATNLTGGGEQTMDKFKSLRDMRPADILKIMDKIAYTGITVFDIEWRLTIVITVTVTFIYTNLCRYHQASCLGVDQVGARLLTVLKSISKLLGTIKYMIIKIFLVLHSQSTTD